MSSKLLSVGQHDEPPNRLMRKAIVTWETVDRWGGKGWVWLQATPISGAVRVQYWVGGPLGERRPKFHMACLQSEDTYSWPQAKRVINMWFTEKGHDLPEVTMESGVRSSLAKIAPADIAAAFA